MASNDYSRRTYETTDTLMAANHKRGQAGLSGKSYSTKSSNRFSKNTSEIYAPGNGSRPPVHHKMTPSSKAGQNMLSGVSNTSLNQGSGVPSMHLPGSYNTNQ